MPWYRRAGKIQTPLSHEQFLEGMKGGPFKRREHKGFLTLLYYSGIRRLEGLRCKPEQFQVKHRTLFFDVGKRLKRGIVTPPLPIPLEKDYVDEIIFCINEAGKEKRIWRFSPKTAYNVVSRVFYYPHHLRLSRITNFFIDNFSIAEVKSWTGLTLKSLDFYIGIAKLIEMGKAL